MRAGREEGRAVHFVFWLIFLGIVVGLLAMDLGVFNRKDHAIGTREALGWTVVWIACALAFNVLVFFFYDRHWFEMGLEGGKVTSDGWRASIDFLTGYLIEKSLSLDNIAVIAVVFTYFGIPLKYQHRVLFWGIVGALLMRGGMILGGIALINAFEWIIYVFGVFLIYTAFKMLRADTQSPDLAENKVLKFVRRIYPVTAEFHGHSFFVRQGGKIALTPLFLALLVVESSDVVFAVDSIPAIFAVTRDPFIVFTSNIFAILGLRSLYFVLASLLERFRHLRYSLVVILAYVGVKMLVSHYFKIPSWVSLSVIVIAITGGMVASVLRGPRYTVVPTPEMIERISKKTGIDLKAGGKER